MMIKKAIQFFTNAHRFFISKRSQRHSLQTKTLPMDNVHQLTRQEENAIKTYWHDVHFDHRWTAYYNSFNEGSFDPRFLPNDIYYTYVDSYFNSTPAARYLENKNLFDLLFHDIRQPKTVIRKIQNAYLSAEYQKISKKEAIQRCIADGNVIIKRCSSHGGKNIEFWTKEEPIEQLEKILSEQTNCIVQHVLKQHDALNYLHASSINTIRIMTLYENGEVSVVSSVIRIGINGNKVDNASQGGITCGILPDGRLKNVAYSFSKRYDKHPQGAIFSNCIIPNYAECIEMVKAMAPRLSFTCRLASWDLAIAEDGHPVLIEVNMNYGGIAIHQLSNGPLFGDKTYDIVKKALDAQGYTTFNKFI